MSELNHRARKILAAVIQEYLATGEAVGSRTVTRRYGVDLSPATVRNVMSDLEEAGLLKQPHTSAGRVPTEHGLRFFVDSLLKVRTLSAREKEELSQHYAMPADDLERMLRDSTRILSELSSHTVVVVAPKLESDVLEHVEFVRLRDQQYLAVLVTRSGRVQNKIVVSPQMISNEELERINHFLKNKLGGLTLEGVVKSVREELQSERLRYQEFERKALELSAQVLPSEKTQVFVEGQTRLFEQISGTTGAAQIDSLKALFRALEEKEHLTNLLEETERAPGIHVFIGAETQIEELADFTVVAASYGSREGDELISPIGTLGVIGPTWMNYSRVINLVDFTAQLLSGFITKR